MGYSFEGVFITGTTMPVADVARLFHGSAREISQPFQGIGVEFTYDDPSDTDEETEHDEEIESEEIESEEIESEEDEFGEDEYGESLSDLVMRNSESLLPHSKTLGEATVVYIEYATFGGPCEHCFGFACKNGEVIPGSAMKMADDDNDFVVLRHLVRYLGAELETIYFEPFERGFFTDTQSDTSSMEILLPDADETDQRVPPYEGGNKERPYDNANHRRWWQFWR